MTLPVRPPRSMNLVVGPGTGTHPLACEGTTTHHACMHSFIHIIPLLPFQPPPPSSFIPLLCFRPVLFFFFFFFFFFLHSFLPQVV